MHDFRQMHDAGKEHLQLAKWLEELRDLKNGVSIKRSSWFDGYREI